MRLIQEYGALLRYRKEMRIWQGIPGIERTVGGKLFVTWYSGGTTEQLGNYCVLAESCDDGVHFAEPIAVIENGNASRCFDPCLWIDPQGRLWWSCAVAPENIVIAYRADFPDADQIVWKGPFTLGAEVMMNKPIVQNNGEWLLPISVWAEEMNLVTPSDAVDRRPFVYRSKDNGESFERLGGPIVENRSFDEHMVVQKRDGSLWALIRTKYGIAESSSYDGGLNWTPAKNSGIAAPDSRFHLRVLKSGAWLLINHVNFTGRNNLAAMLSLDEGKSWIGQLMLDERCSVSYPDATQGDDGAIYIVYDRERGCAKKCIEDVLGCAREILLAKIYEEDILCGECHNPNSFLKRVVSVLGRYEGDTNLFLGTQY